MVDSLSGQSISVQFNQNFENSFKEFNKRFDEKSGKVALIVSDIMDKKLISHEEANSLTNVFDNVVKSNYRVDDLEKVISTLKPETREALKPLFSFQLGSGLIN